MSQDLFTALIDSIAIEFQKYKRKKESEEFERKRLAEIQARRDAELEAERQADLAREKKQLEEAKKAIEAERQELENEKKRLAELKSENKSILIEFTDRENNKTQENIIVNNFVEIDANFIPNNLEIPTISPIHCYEYSSQAIQEIAHSVDKIMEQAIHWPKNDEEKLIIIDEAVMILINHLKKFYPDIETKRYSQGDDDWNFKERITMGLSLELMIAGY